MSVLAEAPILIAILGLSAPVAGIVARLRQRNPFLWLLFGALTGPVATLLLLVAPPGRCPHCDSPVEGWPTACAWCGRGFGVEAASQRAPRPVPQEVAADREPAPPAQPVEVAGPPAAGSRVAQPARTMAKRQRAPGAVPATALGTRVHIERTPDQQSADWETVATGVFVGGNASLEPGSRYLIVRDPNRFRVLGPIERSPDRVVIDVALADADMSPFGDRLVVTTSSGRSDKQLIFQSVAGWSMDPGNDPRSTRHAPLH